MNLIYILLFGFVSSMVTHTHDNKLNSIYINKSLPLNDSPSECVCLCANTYKLMNLLPTRNLSISFVLFYILYKYDVHCSCEFSQLIFRLTFSLRDAVQSNGGIKIEQTNGIKKSTLASSRQSYCHYPKYQCTLNAALI